MQAENCAKFVCHTRDEGHGVLATILGRLEDVRLNTGEGCANSLAGTPRHVGEDQWGVLLAGIERPRDEAPEALRSRVYREQGQVSQSPQLLRTWKELQSRKHGKVEKAKIGGGEYTRAGCAVLENIFK